MGVFNWVQKKFGGKQEKRRSDALSVSALLNDRKEEFSDWPQALLAIGTFGTNDLKDEEPERNDAREYCSHSSNDFSDVSNEKVTKVLQKEVRKLLKRRPKLGVDESDEGGGANLPLIKFTDCPSSLGVDHRACSRFWDGHDLDDKDDGGDRSPSSKIILDRAKDILADNRNDIIKHKSFSFLLKKMLACRSGFAPTPSLIRDPISDSRMDKVLRMIHKKMYTQNPAPSTKRYLEKKDQQETLCLTDKGEGKGEDGGKWVKTDSEYIVLEM